ncbi:MAG TPA: 4'-phosphopantetheinyl transferase superfamily protein [Cyclobacteriaceae bacterium]
MPLAKIEATTNGALALWRIEEDEESLARMVAPFEQVSDSITNSYKRLEWLAGRALIRHLMENMGLQFQGVTKDEFGKPFLVGSDYHLALSHSYPYVAALVDKNESVGIDLEQPKSKLARIAPRVLDAVELNDAGDNITKLCIYWCAKETLIKVYGKKDLTLAKNLKITPFQLNKGGDIIGRIIATGIETTIPLQYSVTENFVLVWSKK